MNTCYIFGAMPIDCSLPEFHNSDLIIAADLGYKHLQEYKIKPHIIVGDFDSLKYIPQGENVFKHPSEKDDTDTILAVNIGLSKGYKNFELFGCLGGRLDHTLANIQTASYICEKGGKAVIKNSEIVLTVIKNSSIKFTDTPQGTFSVFSLSDTSESVYITNAKYPVQNAKLSSNYPIGISNEFIGKDTEIKVKNGTLCIIFGENINYILK